jgi:adenylate cyclase
VRRAPKLVPLSRMRRTLTGVAIGLLVTAGLGALRGTNAFEGLEWRLIDSRTREYLGTSKPDPRIVLATISESDVEAMRAWIYEWPWPLAVNDLAFRWLAACGVAAVVVDVYHFDLGAGEGEWTPLPDGAIEADVLAAAYREVGHVVLAYELASDPPAREPLRIEAFHEKLAALPPMPGGASYERPFVRLPVVRLLRGASRMGYANTVTDGDGISRRFVPFGRIRHVDPGGRSPGEPADAPKPRSTLDDVGAPSLTLATVMEVVPGTRVDAREVVASDVRQRLAEDGTFLVNFRGAQDSFVQVRPSDLVVNGDALTRDPSHPGEGNASRDFLRGKIVVWGVNLPGFKDIVPTPVSEVFPGPEYQATVLDNLLNGDGRVPLTRGENLAILAAVCVVVGAIGGASSRRGVFLGSTVLAALVTLVVGYRWFRAGTSMDLFTPLAGVVFTFSGVIAFRLLTEGRRNKWLETTFGQYLSPAVIEELKKDPTRLSLGGQRTEVSVLFSDIKGFTTLAERLPQDAIVRLLNVYLTGQSEPVLGEDGVIDKFIGDAVMAFFGDPLPHGDHALRACRAALKSQAALAALRPLEQELGLPPLANRIGVNTGPAVVGNMGSDKRFDYTAIGDTVNLASRLEGANKAFGTRILLGSETYEQAKEAIVAKPVARLRVVGKSEPVAVHELLALREGADPALVRHAEAYARAHAAALADDLDGAERALDEALRERPGDALGTWLGELVGRLRSGEAPRPWDGTIVLESKG